MTDHMIPSVEDAAADYRDTWREYEFYVAMHRNHHEPLCSWCDFLAAEAENAALALDMALAQASDRRRAADDELRRSVAW